MTTEIWKSIWEEFAEWYAENEQSSWEEQQKVIEDIVDKYVRRLMYNEKGMPRY